MEAKEQRQAERNACFEFGDGLVVLLGITLK